MASIIEILPDHVINKIAAGEVVERPASVVKELVENSIDAGATDIAVEIEQAGRRMIRISDNGCGMSATDAERAFLRHATSKIASDEDLEAIRTMGFRGEALSSIASVSRIRLVTATPGAQSGVVVEIEAGAVTAVSDTASPQGTSIEVSQLFYNTPARLKFLKSPATEFSHIVTAVSRQAMAHPSIRFRLTHNKKSVLDLPASMGMKERAFQLYGGEISEHIVPFSGGRDNIHVHGLVGRPTYSRGDRTYQEFFVNGRSVKNPSLTHALYAAFGTMLMRDRHPVGFIFIEIDPAFVDVNVHPAKAEVRFRNQSQIHDLVRDVVREGLRSYGMPSGQPAEREAFSAGSVREAVASYLEEQVDGRATSERASSLLFGRRKNDRQATDPRNAPVPAPAGQAFTEDLSSQYRLLQEHDLIPLSQIRDSFIVAQSREGMAIIDQHAAHERVLFERLQDQFDAGELASQLLLVPVPVDVGPSQSELLSEHLPDLQRWGFAVEDYGKGTFIIKAIPSLLVGADCKKLLLDVLDEVNTYGKGRAIETMCDEILSVMACHPAIKVRRHLNLKEMEVLLADLFTCRMPHTCPHGRPTVVSFSMDEIRKMFKRT